MEYKIVYSLRFLTSILIVVLLFTGCALKEASPDYNGLDDFAEYVNNNSDVEINYWSVSDIDKEKKTANIGVIISPKQSFAEIDSIRVAANRFLSDTPEYFLNDYYICITVLDSYDKPSVVYAKFANFEDMTIPISHKVEATKWESLYAVEAFVSKNDLEYLAQLDNIILLRIHPNDYKDESLMIGCLDAVASIDSLNDVYVVDEWYDYFEESDLDCSIHSWIWITS